MKKLNLVYWDSDNFGDILNPALIEELSGAKVQYKDILGGWSNKLVKLVKGMIFLDFNWWRKIFIPGQKTVLAIGSIISWGDKNSVIWGAGFMNENEGFGGGKVLAVRGVCSARKLIQLGFDRCEVFGDPALLLPLWIPEAKGKTHKLSIIPHWKEFDYFKKHYQDRYNIIDLKTRDFKAVINEITSSEYVLSTSLHGIVVSHAYNIPALWIKKGYIDTDGFKFYDYFSSVNISGYQGFSDFEEILSKESNWRKLFKIHMDKSLIQTSLSDIQKNLLRVAPFELKQKYKSIIYS